MGCGPARSCRLWIAEPDTVDELAAAIRRDHGHRDLARSLEGNLMALRLLVGIRRVDCDIGTPLYRPGLDRRLGHALGGDAVVLRPAWQELPEVDAAERERGEARVKGVGHVVGVDLAVALVGDVHNITVGPDTPRAVVAGAAQVRELLVADTLERRRLFVFTGCRGSPRPAPRGGRRRAAWRRGRRPRR